MAKGTTDRGGATDTRQRRAFQRLGSDPFGTLGLAAGDGVIFDSAIGAIAVDLATNPGLAFSSGDLIVIVGAGLELTATGIEIDLAADSGLAFSSGDLIAVVGAGLELTASGIEIDLLASGGLAFSSGDLTLDLRDTNPALELTANGLGVLVSDGLELGASGVAIDLASNPGLAFSSGDLIVTVGAGLELTVTGIEIDLATDPGLEFDSGDLRVKIKSGGGITRDADGLSASGGGGGDSGTYTPTITDGANVASSAAFPAFWTQQGDIVTVYTRATIDPTATNTNTVVNISLPVALGTNFTGFSQAYGLMGIHNNPNDGVVGVINSEPSSATVRATFRPSDSSSKTMQIMFCYNVNPT